MLRKLAPLFLGSALAMSFGCVVVSDDDDTGNDSNNNSNGDDGQATGTAGDGMDDGATAADDGMDDGMDDGATGTAGDTMTPDSGEETAADDTAGVGNCGWGPVKDAMITEGYVCGGMGEDPMMNLPLECPDIDLMVGAPCGDIVGEGCCTGDAVWYCALGANGAEDMLATIPCP